MLTETKEWTYKEYLKIEEGRYEIIEGTLSEMPAPSPKHQEIVGEIFVRLRNFIKERELGKVFIAPVDVVLSENNVLQPDIVVVLKENSDIIKERAVMGSPDMVVEVVSPSTLKRDMEDKRKIYAKFGIKEYWLVFPGEKAVEVLTLKDKEYEVFSFGYENGKVKSCILKDFEINLEEIF